MASTVHAMTDFSDEDYTEEAAYFAGPAPHLDEIAEAAERICLALDEPSDLDGVFGAARASLAEDLDLDDVRGQLELARSTAERCLEHLTQLDNARSAATAAGIAPADLADAITRGCARAASTATQ